MKPLLWLVLLLSFLTNGRAVMLGDAVDFTLPAGWEQVKVDQPTPLPTLKFVPKDGRNASVIVTLVSAEWVAVKDAASLAEFHRFLCRTYLPSPDAKITARELKLEHGSGLYYSFEDPALIGKPVKRDDYKFATPVALWLPPGQTIHATLFTDSTSSRDFTEGMQLLRSAILAADKADSASEKI
jgi:hypothetical protein